MTIVTNGSHIHVTRACMRTYTLITKLTVTFVTGRQATAHDNMPRVGGSASWFLAKHQRTAHPQCRAWQAKLPNSLILRYPDQIGCSLWSVATRFSWAETIRRIC